MREFDTKNAEFSHSLMNTICFFWVRYSRSYRTKNWSGYKWSLKVSRWVLSKHQKKEEVILFAGFKSFVFSFVQQLINNTSRSCVKNFFNYYRSFQIRSTTPAFRHFASWIFIEIGQRKVNSTHWKKPIF